MNFSELSHKKIGGVPVLYIAGGIVAILAVVAWRMKPTPEPKTDEQSSDAVLDENGHADGSDPYAGFRTNGTVIVQQVKPEPEPEGTKSTSFKNNAEWLQAGALWLNKEKNVSPTAAYDALNKYLTGKSRSTQEASWVEAVLAHQGFPPEAFVDSPAVPTAMVAPKGLKATKTTQTSVSLDWDPSPGAAGYQVYVNGKQFGRTVLGSDYVITGLKANTKYTLGAANVYAGWKVGPIASISVTTKK